MDSTSYNITLPPISYEQPPSKKHPSSKAKTILIVFLCLVILINGVIIWLNAPTGAVREVQKIYKDLDGTDEFVTMQIVEEPDLRVATYLLFDRHLFSASESTVMSALSANGLIMMAGIEIIGDVCTWQIEATYDGMKFGRKSGTQDLMYRGTISPALFNADSSLIIEEAEYSTPVSRDFQDFILKYGAQLMAEALDDLNTIMRLASNYGVRDLGFKQF